MSGINSNDAQVANKNADILFHSSKNDRFKVGENGVLVKMGRVERFFAKIGEKLKTAGSKRNQLNVAGVISSTLTHAFNMTSAAIRKGRDTKIPTFKISHGTPGTSGAGDSDDMPMSKLADKIKLQWFEIKEKKVKNSPLNDLTQDIITQKDSLKAMDTQLSEKEVQTKKTKDENQKLDLSAHNELNKALKDMTDEAIQVCDEVMDSYPDLPFHKQWEKYKEFKALRAKDQEEFLKSLKRKTEI